MPRPTVEDVEDPEEMSLPQHPFLANSGSAGPILEEILHSGRPPTGNSSPSTPRAQPAPTSERHAFVSDTSPYRDYREWTTIYPIYMDAKRRYGDERRIGRERSVWWPVSKDIAQAAARIGIQFFHEAEKTHPRDWANPGRVKVLWKKEGRIVYSKARSKRELIELLAAAILATHPHLRPKPVDPIKPSEESTSETIQKKHRRSNRNTTAKPPRPLPPLSQRISHISPTAASGILVETIKAGMNAASASKGPEGAPPIPGASAKGKRKVVRVRG